MAPRSLAAFALLPLLVGFAHADEPHKKDAGGNVGDRVAQGMRELAAVRDQASNDANGLTWREVREGLTRIKDEVAGRGDHYGPLIAGSMGGALDDLHKSAQQRRIEQGLDPNPSPEEIARKTPITQPQLEGFGKWLDVGVDWADSRWHADQPGVDPQQQRKYEADAKKFHEQYEHEQTHLEHQNGPLTRIVQAVDRMYDRVTNNHDGDNPGDGPGQGGHGSSSGGPSFGFGYMGSGTGQSLSDGYNALQNGDYAGATAAADKILSQNPSNLDALNLEARAALQQGDNASANKAANAYLGIVPDDKQMQQIASVTQGRGYGDPAAAAAAGQLGGGSGEAGILAGGAGGAGALGLKTLTADQAAAGSLNRQARENVALDPDQAIALATKAIALDPRNADAYYTRGLAYERKGDHDDALKDAVAGLGVNPKAAALWTLKAGVLAREGHWAEAREAAEAALELNPRNALAWKLEANALAALGDRSGAIKALANAATLDSSFRPLYEAAVNAPADSDLMLLFADADKSAALQGTARRKHRFGTIVGVAVVGGGLIGLGLLQFLLPPLKSAFTKLTRKESAVHAGQLSDAAVPTPRPGESASLLRGQYKILRQIGAGGMGMVFEGEDVSLARKVAVKRMRDEIKADRRERARFVSEAKLVAALHHPNIVDIYSIVEEGDDVFLVFEYINGKTLHEIIQSKGRLTLDEALPLLKGVVDGLEYAHARGIIHRDLKPANVMLDDAGRPRVMDFGIARMAQEAMTRAAMTNTIVGTPPYMAPEQEQGLVRKESDVYALAICLYEMLTGRLAFAGTGAGMLMNKVNKQFAPVTTLAPELPPVMDQVFADALDPEPSKRIASPKELLARVEAAAAARRTA